MIGSLMSRMADAEKLSIPQLNQAVKNGTIPAYVGVPLIQEKMRAEQAAKAVVAQTQAQPPIARQVMEQADMMSGLEKLRSNLPEEGFAGGGIVAFAEGGEAAPAQPAMSIAPPKGYTFDQATGQYDRIQPTGLANIQEMIFGDESPVQRLLRRVRGYDEGGVISPDEDEDEEKNLMGRLMAGITSLKSAMPESYEAMLAQKGQTPTTIRKMMIEGPKKGDYVMPPIDKPERSFRDVYKGSGGHKYENMVVAEAQRIGLDPGMALHVLYKETGNLKNPESARSKAGALGVMQLMPKTAKSLGVDPLNPEENIRGGVMYLKQMYDKYQDPTLAFAAYNAGPGRVDKALRSGQGIAALPRETQNYVMASNRMAGGGIVAFAGPTGSLVKDDEPTSTLGSKLSQLFGPMVGGKGGGFEPTTEEDKAFARNYVEQQKRQRDIQKQLAAPELDLPFYKAVRPSERAEIERRRNELMGQMSIAQQAQTNPSLAPATGTPMSQMEAQDIQEGLGATTAFDKLMAAQAKPDDKKEVPEPYKEPPADQGLSDIKNLLKQRMEESGKQKRIDAYLSLLQAGLGMMGGTSPFAAANIGQGAATGVAAQMAARKAQVADENAILTGQLGLSRAELYEKMRRDALRQKAEEAASLDRYRQGQLGLGAGRTRALETKNYLTAQKQFTDQGGQLEIENRYKRQYGKNWRDDATHLRNFEREVKARINELAGRIGDSDIPLSTER